MLCAILFLITIQACLAILPQPLDLLQNGYGKVQKLSRLRLRLSRLFSCIAPSFIKDGAQNCSTLRTTHSIPLNRGSCMKDRFVLETRNTTLGRRYSTRSGSAFTIRSTAVLFAIVIFSTIADDLVNSFHFFIPSTSYLLQNFFNLSIQYLCRLPVYMYASTD